MRLPLLLGLTTLAASTTGIIRRADRPDERYLAAGAKYTAVIALGRVGDATLIAPQWLLTAGHVANAVANGRRLSEVLIAGERYPIDRVVVHPQWREMGPHDIGLVHLARAVRGTSPIAM